MSINIYVGNLSYKMTISDLRGLFEPFGEIESAKIITDRHSGNSKGFGFVEMANRHEAEQAVEQLNGKEVQGRTLKVSEAYRPKDKREYRGKTGRSIGNKDHFLRTNSRKNF